MPRRLSKRPRALAVGAALLAAGGLAVAPAAAQSGGEVLETALERYEQRMAGVENYTVVQEVLGAEHTTYFEAEEVDGRKVFRPVPVGVEEEAVQQATVSEGQSIQQEQWSDPYQVLTEVTDRAELAGKEAVDGEETFVVTVDDFSGTSLAESVSPAQGSFQARSGTFYIDDDDYLLLKLTMEGTQQIAGGSHDVAVVAFFSDYREVDGVVHPFRAEIRADGFQTGYSEEELENARRQMEELREQMESMPESQRSMMEGMLGPQMEKFQEMLATGTMNFTVTVKEIRVNAGPPEEG